MSDVPQSPADRYDLRSRIHPAPAAAYPALEVIKHPVKSTQPVLRVLTSYSVVGRVSDRGSACQTARKQGARAIFCRLEPCLRCVLGNDAGDRIDPLRHAAGLICHVFLDHILMVRILECGHG
jgi:hypothetical protein